MLGFDPASAGHGPAALDQQAKPPGPPKPLGGRAPAAPVPKGGTSPVAPSVGMQYEAAPAFNRPHPPHPPHPPHGHDVTTTVPPGRGPKGARKLPPPTSTTSTTTSTLPVAGAPPGPHAGLTSTRPAPAPAPRANRARRAGRAGRAGRGGTGLVAIGRPAPSASPPGGSGPAGAGSRFRLHPNFEPPMVNAGGAWTGPSLKAASGLTVPILFGLLIALFILLQARIDRRDPKMASSPERGSDETVGFE